MQEHGGIVRTELLRAAQYLRMSTEHQQYSIEHQSATIAIYAAAHGMGIVRSYTDGAKSGLTIGRRDALQTLIRTIEKGQTDYECVLVYDVSRWGRFQDADESAFYEYICKRAGIQVRYCAEQFENDNSPTSNLLKALKRTMAGEYSRELSAKVFAAQCRSVELGFRQGGPAPYGLRRQIVDPKGVPRQILEFRERKNLRMDRIILVPGPEKEVRVVREIYDLFTKKKKTIPQIAAILRERGEPKRGRPWNPRIVFDVLTNPSYKGANIYARRNTKLGQKQHFMPEETWLIKEGVFEAIVSPKQFAKVQEIIRRRRRHWTDEEMLDGLRKLWAREGTLSARIVNRSNRVPCSLLYIRRFGSLMRAYDLIGFPINRDYSFVESRRTAKKIRDKLRDEIAYRIRAVGGTVELQPNAGFLKINDGITVAIMFSRCNTWREGHPRWALNFGHRNSADVLIIVRLDQINHSVFDYYVVPKIANLRGKFRVGAKNNAAFLDLYRMNDLGPFINTMRRTWLPGRYEPALQKHSE